MSKLPVQLNAQELAQKIYNFYQKERLAIPALSKEDLIKMSDYIRSADVELNQLRKKIQELEKPIVIPIPSSNEPN